MAKLIIGVNDLNTTHPHLSKEADGWNTQLFTAGSKKKQKWICNLSHKWETEIKDRSRKNTGCPVCFGRKTLTGYNDLETRYPDIAKQAIGWDPKVISPGTHKKFKWICNIGHIWEASPNHRTSKGDGCPVCSKTGFNPNNEAYLYLIYNKNFDMLKIGITNSVKRRLGEHKKDGWELIESIGPKEGKYIKNLEFLIIKSLKSKGAIFASDINKKFYGYTESWKLSSYNDSKIDEIISIEDNCK